MKYKLNARIKRKYIISKKFKARKIKRKKWSNIYNKKRIKLIIILIFIILLYSFYIKTEDQHNLFSKGEERTNNWYNNLNNLINKIIIKYIII